jgi:glycosyltransferase involved in cell wall biosynthesis
MCSKGVDLLINSFVSVAKELLTWKLVIVGPVWEADYMRDCQNIANKAGLVDRILFVGYAEGQDLYRWYHFAEIYVLPSREEGLANRLPEAMYFENPIIAFDVGQTKSMVDESCGVLLPPMDTDGLSHFLIVLARDEKLRKFKANNARRRVEADYDDSILISGLLKFVEKSIL